MQSGKTGYPYYHSATFVANTMQTIRKLLVMILSCIVWLWLPPQIQAAKKQHKSSRTISKAWTNKDWRLTPIPTMYTIPLKAISRVDQQQQQQQIKSVAPEHKWILLHFLFWPNSCKNEMEKFHYIRMILHTLSISNHLVGLPNPHYFQVSWRIWLLTTWVAGGLDNKPDPASSLNFAPGKAFWVGLFTI